MGQSNRDDKHPGHQEIGGEPQPYRQAGPAVAVNLG